MLIAIDERTRQEKTERLGNEIALLAAHITVATARLLQLIREFDGLCGWATASSPAPTG